MVLGGALVQSGISGLIRVQSGFVRVQSGLVLLESQWFVIFIRILAGIFLFSALTADETADAHGQDKTDFEG